MRRAFILLTLALSACMPPAVQTAPAPMVAQVSVPAVAPAVAPAVTPAGPLMVLDDTLVTVALQGETLTVALSPGVPGVWFRLLLPSGEVSPITGGACGCLGLGGEGPHSIAFTFLPGLTVLTSLGLDGPYTPAARTR